MSTRNLRGPLQQRGIVDVVVDFVDVADVVDAFLCLIFLFLFFNVDTVAAERYWCFCC